MEPTTAIRLQKAPDFWLSDATGREFHLYDHLAPGGTVLVFYRGHWCPYCRRYLAKLRDAAARFEGAEAQLIAISPEPPANGSALAAELSLNFPLLSDVDGFAIDAYGTRNGLSHVAAPLRGRSLIPHPAVFIINAQGDICFQALDRNYKKRTTLRTIFSHLAELRSNAMSK